MRGIVLGVAALVMATSASAGWRNTEWGMTAAEVSAATGAQPAGASTLAFIGPVDFAGFRFDRVYFDFGANGLRQVTLSSDATPASEVRGALASQAGQPASQSEGYAFFADRPHQNSIRVNGGSNSVVLVYRPLATGF